MATPLADLFAPPGIRSPDMAALLDFHENTKASPETDYFLVDNIYQYLFEYRGRAETAANRKNYLYFDSEPLPPPRPLDMGFATLLAQRKSTRQFAPVALDLQHLSDVLGALGSNRRVVLDAENELVLNLRPYPSPGGLFPSEIYLVLSNVAGRNHQVCHYDPIRHRLTPLGTTDAATLAAALGGRGYAALEGAAVVVFVTSTFERVSAKYGIMGYRFALIETGIVLQQTSSAATAAGLATLVYAGFFDEEVNAMLGVDGQTETVTGCILLGTAQ